MMMDDLEQRIARLESYVLHAQIFATALVVFGIPYWLSPR